MGKNIQYAQTNTNNDITKEQKKLLQQIIGYYLYYGRAIDNTILPSLGSISTSLNTSTWKELSSRVKWLLDYIATHPEPKIEYQASDMHLWVNTDASYLNNRKLALKELATSSYPTNQIFLFTPMILHHPSTAPLTSTVKS